MSAIGGGNAFDPRSPRRIGLKLEEKTDAAREVLISLVITLIKAIVNGT